MTSPTIEVAPPPPLPGAARAERWSRASDRLNPILVREVQQAIKGRVFAVMVLLALLLTVVVALLVASEFRPDGRAGRQAFEGGVAILVPLLVFVVPMQAYHSMRLELRGGIVEQLLLSRLRPRSILLGKLQAALVQFGLYVAVVAPLLATSYLLRGVDLPTIAVTLLFAALLCATATMVTVSSAAQSVLPALQSVATLGTTFGLGIGTFGLIGFVLSGEYMDMVGDMLRSGWFLAGSSAVVLVALLASALSMLAAQAFLLHTFENKASGFRVLLFTAPLLVYGWMLCFVDASRWRYMIPSLGFMMLVVGLVFGLFMVTEQRDLSPRVRSHVPRSRGLALLVAPFLPGRDRGHLCVALYLVLLGGLIAALWPTGLAVRSMDSGWRQCSLIVGYGLLFLGIGRFVRDRLPSTLAGNHIGRVVLPVLLIAAMVVPMLIDVFTQGSVRGWHVGHALNPFWTIFHFGFDRGDRDGFGMLLAVLALAVLLQVPSWLRGVREVLRAAAARRQRTAEAASGASVGGRP